MKICVDSSAALEAGYGPNSVFLVSNVFVKLDCAEKIDSDFLSMKLACRFWVPDKELAYSLMKESDTDEEPWLLYDSNNSSTQKPKKKAAVLEYLPYRNNDVTASRDFLRHTWLASHGFIVVRVDMRGSGNSDGLLTDEYTPEELDDGCQLITWLSEQKWCNGRVGLFGKSWGGFNGLQLAAMQPRGLAAVISLYSTDDRYKNDIHYCGGCIIGSEMLSWSSYMFAINALPPNPTYRSNDWQMVWRQRLEQSCRPWIQTWMRHPRRDDYWLHGSVCADYHKLQIPILAIGGWKDLYRDAVFRLVKETASSKSPVRGLVGPWSHDWPDVAKPGPRIEFMKECLRWWNSYLLDYEEPEVDNMPALRIFIQNGLIGSMRNNFFSPLENGSSKRDGCWLAFPSWPCTAHTQVCNWIFQNDKKMVQKTTVQLESVDFTHDCSVIGQAEYSEEAGLWSGELLSFGEKDGSLDQSWSNSRCTALWTTDPVDIEDGLHILGEAKLYLRCSVKQTLLSGQLAARLCDLAPGGENCALISHGIVNLCSNEDFSDAGPINCDEIFTRVFLLLGTSYHLKRGHSLQLALSTSYWPLVWPSVSMNSVRLHAGCRLELPCLQMSAFHKLQCSDNTLLAEQSVFPQILTENLQTDKPSFGRGLSQDFVSGGVTVWMKQFDNPADLLINGIDDQIRLSWTYENQHSLAKDNPLSAVTNSQHHLRWSHRPTNNVVNIETTSSMMCSEEEFFFKNKLCVYLNKEEFFCKEYIDTIKRDCL